jgi:competence protein ComEA
VREVSNPDDAVRERLRTVLGDVPADPGVPVSSGDSGSGAPVREIRHRRPPTAPTAPGRTRLELGDVPDVDGDPRDAADVTDVDGRDRPRAGVPGPAGLTAAGAFDPGRRGTRALAAVAAVVVLVAGFLAWRARPQVDPLPPVPSPVAVDATGPSAGPAGEVVVAVGGKVRRPGLVRLPAGSRVADALQAAGGANPGVDPSLLNLARRVVDGELIMVGASPPPGPAPGGPAGGAAPAGGPVNLNTATLADLDTLPGVGPVLAQRIVAHREKSGGFKAVGDLRKVDGIGSSRFEQLKDLVTV